MVPHAVHDRAELAALLRRDPALHAYELGDLDDFFWPYTTWYRLADQVALVYHGAGTPTLLAFAPPEHTPQYVELLHRVVPLLPRRCHAHLSPGGADVLSAAGYRLASGGPHHKMALAEPIDTPDRDDVEPLTGADLPQLRDLYEQAYPENWFDPRMLDTGQYVGIRHDGRLVAVAGVHVWSPTYRVAALGNVTTHPDLRGKGLASAAVAALCRRLRDTVDHVTLNVKADNHAALALYRRLGFTTVADYNEYTVG